MFLVKSDNQYFGKKFLSFVLKHFCFLSCLNSFHFLLLIIGITVFWVLLEKLSPAGFKISCCSLILCLLSIIFMFRFVSLNEVNVFALASQKVLDFLRPSDTQFIRKKSNNSRNNMKSQTKNKKKRSISLRNY